MGYFCRVWGDWGVLWGEDKNDDLNALSSTSTLLIRGVVVKGEMLWPLFSLPWRVSWTMVDLV